MRWICSLGVAVLVAVLLQPPAPATAGYQWWLPAPPSVTAETRGLDLVVSWDPATTDNGVPAGGYEVQIWRENPDGPDSQVRAFEVGPDVTSIDVAGLPRVAQHWAQISAHYGEDFSGFAQTERVRILSTLSMSDTSPIVVPREGGGVAETYVVERELVLDAPMPVDVYLTLVDVSSDGEGLTPAEAGGYPQDPDPGWPLVAFPPYVIRAGETRATIHYTWWGDEWRRFTWAQRVWSIEAGNLREDLPTLTPAVHIAPGTHQSFTLYEDDTELQPTAHVPERRTVKAGRVARVPLRLDHAVSRRTVVRVVTRDRSARHGRDYRAFRGSTTIKRGQRIAWVSVPTRARPHNGSSSFEVRILGARSDARVGGRDRTLVRIRG